MNEFTTIHNWQPIESINPLQLDFTIVNLMEYFVHRKATDGNPVNDFKDVNTKAFPLFRAGHVQSVVQADHMNHVFLKAFCSAEMKKKVVYELHIVINKSSFDVVAASCECTVGRGPE